MTNTTETMRNNEKGSFMIELLITFAIISIAMTVIVDAFISSQHSYFSATEKADLTSVISFLLEDMTQEARVSKDFTCGGTPPPCSASGGGATFGMTHIEGLNGAGPGEDLTYTLNGNTMKKDFTTEYDMTPPSIIVENFTVDILGTEPNDPIRARVTIKAYSIDDPGQVIQLQTSFTTRTY